MTDIQSNISHVSPEYSPEEMVANSEIVILFKISADPELLLNALKNSHRIAGGSLFNVNASIVKDGMAPDASLKRKKQGLIACEPYWTCMAG